MCSDEVAWHMYMHVNSDAVVTVQVVFVLCFDIVHNHCSFTFATLWQQNAIWGDSGCDYIPYLVFNNTFRYAGEWWSSQEDFKGPDRPIGPSCRRSLMLGVWSVHLYCSS